MVGRALAMASLGALLLPGNASAHGTRIMTVVRTAAAEQTALTKRLSLALEAALEAAPGYRRLDLDAAFGGAELQRGRREIDAARRKVRRGREALNRLAVREGTELLREAIPIYKANATVLTDVDELSQALMALGAISWHGDRVPAAKRRFAEAVALTPDIEPNAEVFNPAMRRAFDEVAARARSSTGSLAIESTPEGALAMVDGRVVGLTPVTVDELISGSHLVRVVSDGRLSWGRMVDAVAGTRTRVAATLDSIPSLRGLPGRITDAFVAVSRGKRAGAFVTELGRSVAVDQILFVRLRQREADWLAEAALYSVRGGVRLARSEYAIASANLTQPAAALVGELRPPPLSFLVAAVRTTRRTDLGRDAKHALTRVIEDLGGSVSFLSTPLPPRCLKEPTCVTEATKSLNVDGVLELDLRATGRPAGRVKVRSRCVDGRTGNTLVYDQATVTVSDILEDRGLLKMMTRAVHALWETRAARGEVTRGNTTAPPMDTVVWDPTALDSVLDAPVPEPAEPISWGRILGWSTTALGTAAAVGGLAMAVDRNAVLENPDTTGAEKADAKRVGLLAAGAAVAGLGVAALGAWLTWDSYPGTTTD